MLIMYKTLEEIQESSIINQNAKNEVQENKLHILIVVARDNSNVTNAMDEKK